MLDDRLLVAQYDNYQATPHSTPLSEQSSQPDFSFQNQQFPSIVEQSPLSADNHSSMLESGHSFQFGPVKVQTEMASSCTETPLTTTPQPPAKIVEESFYGIVFKNSYQEISYLIGEGDDLGITTLRVSETISFSKLPLLSLTPEFGVHFFHGPDQTDLPGQVFSTGLKISWFQPISEEWKFIANVTPGYYSDFDSTQDALRISGLALAIYKWSEELTWTFGVVYLPRDDVRILPAVGLTYSPDADHKLELTFPRPRYSWRTGHDDSGDSWAYIGSEFGGGTWSIRRENGEEDLLNLRDFRAIVGWEKREDKSSVDFIEVGYVFSRQVEYDSGIGDYSPDDGFVIRSGWTF